MFSEVIRSAVIGEAQRVITHHTAMAAARAGTITPAGVSSYLASVHYMLQHTVPHLERALQCAQARGLSALSVFFQKKMKEEQGHDRWSAADIQRYGLDHAEAAQAEPVAAARDLIQFIHDTIDRDPHLYVVYILVNEYFTVLTGPVWIDALGGGCGVPSDALTAVGKHVAADQAHAASGFALIDELLDDPSLADGVDQLLSTVFSHFSAVLEQASQVTVVTAAARGSAV